MNLRKSVLVGLITAFFAAQILAADTKGENTEIDGEWVLFRLAEGEVEIQPPEKTPRAQGVQPTAIACAEEELPQAQPPQSQEGPAASPKEIFREGLEKSEIPLSPSAPEEIPPSVSLAPDQQPQPPEFAEFMAALERDGRVVVPPRFLDSELVEGMIHTSFLGLPAAMGSLLVPFGVVVSVEQRDPRFLTISLYGLALLGMRHVKLEPGLEAFFQKLRVKGGIGQGHKWQRKHWEELLKKVTWITPKLGGRLMLGKGVPSTSIMSFLFEPSYSMPEAQQESALFQRCLTHTKTGKIDFFDLTQEARDSLIDKQAIRLNKRNFKVGWERTLLCTLFFGAAEICSSYIHTSKLPSTPLAILFVCVMVTHWLSPAPVELIPTEAFMKMLSEAMGTGNFTRIFEEDALGKFATLRKSLSGKSFVWLDGSANLNFSSEKPRARKNCVEVDFPKYHQD